MAADMREGWERRGVDVRPWYWRQVAVGPLHLQMDVWQGDMAGGEWFYSLQDRNAEHAMPFKTADHAMRAAEQVLASYLRSAARALRKSTTE